MPSTIYSWILLRFWTTQLRVTKNGIICCQTGPCVNELGSVPRCIQCLQIMAKHTSSVSVFLMWLPKYNIFALTSDNSFQYWVMNYVTRQSIQVSLYAHL